MDSFIGEIRAFGFSYAPAEWATCDGQTMPVAQNPALAAVLGNAFGGDGRNTFGLPNLQGSVPVGSGNGPGLTPRSVGARMGSTSVALTAANFPTHTHTVQVLNGNATVATASTNVLGKAVVGSGARAAPVSTYSPAAATHAHLAADAVQPTGAPGAVPRSTLQPYLPVILCISLYGAFPVRP